MSFLEGNLWISDETSATTIYGDINTWDVSAITDFSSLFQEKENFLQHHLMQKFLISKKNLSSP